MMCEAPPIQPVGEGRFHRDPCKAGAGARDEFLTSGVAYKMPPSKRIEAIGLFDSFIAPVSIQSWCLRTCSYVEINNGDDMLLLEEWYSRHGLERPIFWDNSQKIPADMEVTEEK